MKRLIIRLLSIVLPLLAGVWLSFQYVKRIPQPLYDSAQYVTGAYNMAKYGVSSVSTLDSPKVPADLVREPVTSFLLSLPMRGMDLDRHSLACFLAENVPCEAQLRWLVAINIVQVALIILGAHVAVSWLTGSPWLSLAAATLIATCSLLPSFTRIFSSEVPAALFLLWHSIFLYGAFTGKRRRICAVGAGILLAALALTKAIYSYWLLVFWLAAVVAMISVKRARGQGIPVTLLLVLIPASVGVGAWMMRNYFHFDRLALTERATSVLAIRASYTRMSWEQYRSGYLYFTPYFGPDLAQRFSGDLAKKTYDDNELGWIEKHMLPGLPSNWQSLTESQLRYGIIGIMLENWDRQIALIPLMAYRGMFVGGCCSTLGNDLPKYWNVSPGPAIWAFWAAQAFVTALLGPALLLLIFVIVRRRNWISLLILAPTMFHFLIYSVATQFYSRFSVPVYPSMVVAFIALGGIWIADARERRIRS